MPKYSKQVKMLMAVDCIIFGFDGNSIKILLIQRAMQPNEGEWSLMGGFVQPNEDMPAAAARVLQKLTGLTNIYLEELHSFSHPKRDPIERTISIAYFALIDINKYEKQLSTEFHAEWFPLTEIPTLIFDHNKMVETAKHRLRYKAAFHPILFELLPNKFTLPQLQSLYETVYDIHIDKRNFSRKVLSTGLLVKQNDKEKSTSKKGAFYYRVNKKKYEANFHTVLNIIPKPSTIFS